jgi:putative protease
MLACEKSTTITNVKGVSFAIDKQKGGYPSIYNNEQFLNVDIVNDLGDLFDEFFIDLTDIGSGSKAEPDKEELITQFENMLNGDENAQQNLHKMVELSTRNQYRKGL